MLLAVDPGLRKCGAAEFDRDSRLVWAGVIKAEPAGMKDTAAWEMMTRSVMKQVEGRITEVVVEFPKVYQGGKQKGDPADLLELAAVVGSIARAMQGRSVFRYFPHEWKGQMDKVTCYERVRERLDEVELGNVGTSDHNAWDAIGLGLFHLGRFDRKRVIAR